mmetsp:Transcript_116707/g.174255  ORF Transcript_116707/g.174255 Transcript_116707/m.174255 type:complete len:107 (+) Transcript_116707:79-399(+)
MLNFCCTTLETKKEQGSEWKNRFDSTKNSEHSAKLISLNQNMVTSFPYRYIRHPLCTRLCHRVWKFEARFVMVSAKAFEARWTSRGCDVCDKCPTRAGLGKMFSTL